MPAISGRCAGADLHPRLQNESLSSMSSALAAGVAAHTSARTEPYVDDVTRAFVLATVFWGVAAFAAGVFIALQLAFPELNLGLEWTTFGRLRPLHTSAAIFAFGGNALI